MSDTAVCFAPREAATGKPLKLTMQRLWLTGRVLPAGARLVAQHVFRSEEKKPLEVIYSFPLPRDAALRSFRIAGEGFEAHSELRETEAAVRAYEQGIAQGSLSALARNYGDGLVNLTVGNIRAEETVTVYLEILAGVELHDDGFRFRFPFTLAPGYHSKARTAVAGPRQGEMELPAEEFGDMILPAFHEDACALHQVGFDLEVTSSLELEELGSPSHSIRVGRNRVSLAPEKDVPNRDLVLDARVRHIEPHVLSGPVDGRTQFAAIIPSSRFGAKTEAPRRVVILLDRSGSMGGSPIEQAKKSVEACLGAMSDNDEFGLIAFDDHIEQLEPHLLPATRENRERARHFLRTVDSRGGTELAAGVTAASQLLAGGGGDVLIMTDGQVMGTEEILARARSTGSRLHSLGIGSASQDRFLTLLARETGGISRFVGPRERVDMCAIDLFASIGRPIASGLKADDVRPEPPAAVWSGSPVLLFGETDAAEITVTWDNGQLKIPLPSGTAEVGETVWLLRGSRLITDWESRYPSAEALAPMEKRKQSRVAGQLLRLSEEYGLASREMSLVAVVKRLGDKPGDLPETRVVPVGMPQDVNFGAYFGTPRVARLARAFASNALDTGTFMAAITRADAMFSVDAEIPPRPTPSHGPEDELVELASRIEPDGGMPGATEDERTARTIAALFAFIAGGSTLTSGPFRAHVARVVRFLEGHARPTVTAALQRARHGRIPRGDWLRVARGSRDPWPEIADALLS